MYKVSFNLLSILSNLKVFEKIKTENETVYGWLRFKEMNIKDIFKNFQTIGKKWYHGPGDNLRTSSVILVNG